MTLMLRHTFLKFTSLNLIGWIILCQLYGCVPKKEGLEDYFSATTKAKTTIFIAIDPSTCWKCYPIYWELYRKVESQPELQLYLIVRNLKRIEKKKLIEDLKFQFSERIMIIESSNLFKELLFNFDNMDQNIAIESKGVIKAFNGERDYSEIFNTLDQK